MTNEREKINVFNVVEAVFTVEDVTPTPKGSEEVVVSDINYPEEKYEFQVEADVFKVHDILIIPILIKSFKWYQLNRLYPDRFRRATANEVFQYRKTFSKRRARLHVST